MSPEVVVKRSLFRWSVLAATLASATATPACGGRGGVSSSGPSEGGAAGAAGSVSDGAAGSVADGAAGAAADGAAGSVADGAAGSCATGRLTAPEAASLYRTYAFEVKPDLYPGAMFELRELEVEGLWQGLNAQLFDVGGRDETGAFVRDCTILTHACRVSVPAGECDGFGSLKSGLVANGAFYFSWGWGSGEYRSQIGKLTPDGTSFTRVVSAPYKNASHGPPPLVVKMAGTDILVDRAFVTGFNEWFNIEPVGKLDDRRDSLIVVDGSGQPLANPLP